MAHNIPVWRQLEHSPLPPPDRRDAPVVIVGGGPVGLAMAIDLGQRGQPVVVLQKFPFVAAGSKAICYSKRSLDILDRLGVGEAAVARGVSWDIGKVFWQDRRDPVYSFDMLPVKHQKMPGFINLQQYHLEDILIARAEQIEGVDLRFGHEVTAIEQHASGARLSVETADGAYQQGAEWVIACDGSRSTLRRELGLEFEGRIFEESFLIADIRMRAERPAERWFWFDPPFNPGQTALLHRQPDDVWRLDFQLGWEVDREAAIRPENVDPLIRGMLGGDIEYEPVWYSIYTFQCRRMERFVHDRVIFAGDAAHLVSPFGARGCNGGFADIDNLGWKLDLMLRGLASSDLLDSYGLEAGITADENILNSTRSTTFITPPDAISQAYRDAVLELSRDCAFARAFVNSGRLSTAVAYPETPLNSPDVDDWGGAGVAPGYPALDAPLGNDWLLERLGGGGFVLLHNGAGIDAPDGVSAIDLAAEADAALACERYALAPGSATLLRPDQYVAARWQAPSRDAVVAATHRAMGAER